MFLPNDLKSRLKGFRHPAAAETGEVSNPALVAWAALLSLGLIAIVIVGVVSYQRFSYWKDIDMRLLEQSGGVTYDEEKLEKVLQEFENRSKRSEEILLIQSTMELEVATTTSDSMATTTATSTENVDE